MKRQVNGSEPHSNGQADSERREQRQVMLGLADAQALVLILKGWLPVLQKMAQRAPELHADVFSLRCLLRRLERFGEQDAEMDLTYDDLAILDLSLAGFGQLLRQKVPQSAYRDMVLQSIDWLSEQFAELHKPL